MTFPDVSWMKKMAAEILETTKSRSDQTHAPMRPNLAACSVVILTATCGIDTATCGIDATFFVARICHGIAFSSLSGSHGQENGTRIFVMCRLAGALDTGLSGIGLGLYLLFKLATQT
ncbi:hypothetical protein [Ascidiaceihabitans sp.]|uniref:hypothetical protein n=1 Tax=Ascidiaceihabitans sp. TaxID=1872644 RepID=UPI0032984F8E